MAAQDYCMYTCLFVRGYFTALYLVKQSSATIMLYSDLPPVFIYYRCTLLQVLPILIVLLYATLAYLMSVHASHTVGHLLIHLRGEL